MAIDDYGIWQGTGSVPVAFCQHYAFCLHSHDRIVDADRFSKRSCCILVIDRDSDNLEPLIAVCLLQIDEIGYFFFTGWTPGGPEV